MTNKKDMPLADVKPGQVFMFYEYGTKRTIAPKMLRLNNCYAELGGVFDCVDVLDGKDIELNEEIVCVLGTFRGYYAIRGAKQ